MRRQLYSIHQLHSLSLAPPLNLKPRNPLALPQRHLLARAAVWTRRQGLMADAGGADALVPLPRHRGRRSGANLWRAPAFGSGVVFNNAHVRIDNFFEPRPIFA